MLIKWCSAGNNTELKLTWTSSVLNTWTRQRISTVITVHPETINNQSSNQSCTTCWELESLHHSCLVPHMVNCLSWNELFLQNVTIFMWELYNLLSNSHKCVFWGHSDLWPLSSNQLIFVAVDMKTFPRGVSGTDDTFILTEVTIWFLISENFSFLHHNFHFNWKKVSGKSWWCDVCSTSSSDSF